MTPRTALLLLLVFCTPRGQAQIITLPGLPSEPFFSLASRGDTLLAGAERLYVSTDAGTTWQARGQLAPDAPIDALVQTNAGWFASSLGRGVYHSADEGRSWSGYNAGLTGLGATSVNALVERSGWLYAATEGGVFRLNLHPLGTWQRYGTEFAENAAETVAALRLHDNRLIAAAGGNGLVFLEDSAQQSWSPVFVGGHLLDLTVTGGALVATARNRSSFSLDNGRTWQQTGPGLPSGIYATLATAGEYTYAAHTIGENVSRLYRSSDLTGPWEPLGTVSEVLRMLAHGSRLYLAQADGLRAYALSPTPNDPEEVPGGARLEAPVPNPAGGSTRISFRLEVPGHAHVAAYDLLGRRVSVLFDGTTPAGQTVLLWGLEAVPAGIYTLRLVTSEAVLTERLVVLR